MKESMEKGKCQEERATMGSEDIRQISVFGSTWNPFTEEPPAGILSEGVEVEPLP